MTLLDRRHLRRKIGGSFDNTPVPPIVIQVPPGPDPNPPPTIRGNNGQQVSAIARAHNVSGQDLAGLVHAIISSDPTKVRVDYANFGIINMTILDGSVVTSITGTIGGVAIPTIFVTGLSTPLAAQHTFWRVVGVTFAGVTGKFGLSAMGFKDNTGNVISTAGETVLESNHFGTNPATNLFDGVDATFWEVTPTGTDTAYAGIQFATGKLVRQVMLQRTASMDSTNPPAEMLVQCSDNGSVWYTAAWLNVGTLVNDTPTWFDFTNLYPTFPRTDFGSHKYWRMHDVAAFNNSWTALSAILFKDNNGVLIPTTGGSALESAHWSTFDSSALFDGNNVTFWESANASYNSWAGYEFATPQKVMQIALQRTASMDNSNPPLRCRFEFSDDGSTWGIAASVEVGTLTNDVPTWFNLAGGL